MDNRIKSTFVVSPGGNAIAAPDREDVRGVSPQEKQDGAAWFRKRFGKGRGGV